MNAYFPALPDAPLLEPSKQAILPRHRRPWLSRPLSLVCCMAMVTALLMLSALPLDAQGASISCTSTQIASAQGTGSINPSSIVAANGGEIIYLESNHQENISTLYRVAADNTLTELGQLQEMLGVYGFPRWDVDTQAGNVIYTSYVEEDYGIPSTAIFMDLNSGEQITLMGGVNESDFGRIDGLIWWSSRDVPNADSDYGLHLYDPSSKTINAFIAAVAGPDDWAISAQPVRVEPNGDVLFTVTRFTSDPDIMKVYYYRGDPQTGANHFFHSEALGFDQYSYSEATTLLEERAAFIDDQGNYQEIDFHGNELRRISMLGPGIYRDLQPTPSGILFTYLAPDDSNMRSLHHLSQSGELSTLTPSGESLRYIPPNIRLISRPDGATYLWFATDHPSDRNLGTLFVYALPPDESATFGDPVLIVDDVGDFYSSPTDAYIVANIKGDAVIIDTVTFEQTLTGTAYGARSVFFDGDEAHVIDHGRVQFVDTEQDIVYFTSPIPPEDEYVLYASSYDIADQVRVSLPEVSVPFDLHSRSFFLTPDNDVIYIGDQRQTLYRAQCVRTD